MNSLQEKNLNVSRTLENILDLPFTQDVQIRTTLKHHFSHQSAKIRSLTTDFSNSW